MWFLTMVSTWNLKTPRNHKDFRNSKKGNVSPMYAYIHAVSNSQETLQTTVNAKDNGVT